LSMEASIQSALLSQRTLFLQHMACQESLSVLHCCSPKS
jgi:hypothetical protein